MSYHVCWSCVAYLYARKNGFQCLLLVVIVVWIKRNRGSRGIVSATLRFFSIDRRRPFHHVLLGTIDRVDFFLSGDSDAVGHCGDPPQGRKNPRHPSWWMLRYKTMDFIHRSKQDASGHWTHVIDPVNEVEPVPKHSPYNYVVQLLLSTNCI